MGTSLPGRKAAVLSPQLEIGPSQSVPLIPGYDASTAADRYGRTMSAPARTSLGPNAQAAGAPRARLPRPQAIDLAAAALVAYIGAWNAPSAERGLLKALSADSTSWQTAAWLLVLGTSCAAVVLRRVSPAAAVATIGCAMAAQVVLFNEGSLAGVALCLIAVETCTSRLARPWSWALLAAGYLAAGGAVLWVGYLGGQEVLEPTRAAVLVAMTWTSLTVAALTGLLRRRAREKVEQALERAQVLVAQQDTERRLAVAEERQRIARDVHDLLGHCLSVIGMQAAGARAVLDKDPQAADHALAVIGETSRKAVEEVRGLVDVLRAPEPLPPTAKPGLSDPQRLDTPAQPQVGLEGLGALVSGSRQAGLTVSLSLVEEAQTSPAVGEAVYRMVQESLTNVLHHAPGAATTVKVVSGPQGVEAQVTNEPAPCQAEPLSRSGRAGTGLAAMRERFTSLGGDVQAGPRDNGGWQVRALVPAGQEEK